MKPPDTRTSLITRLAQVGDQDAWIEFCSLYEPLIYRQARRYGMQHADAREMVQDVLVAVSSAIERFQPDPQRGRFRSWLFAIGHRISLKHFRGLSRPDRATGGDGSGALADQAQDRADDGATRAFETELRRSVFRHVADLVRRDFAAVTWQAFWKTSVLHESIPNVARELKLTVGSVYVARSRVMARLRQRADEITSNDVAIVPSTPLNENRTMRWNHRRSSRLREACDENDLHAMLWGQLDAGREKRLTRHLESCGSCQRTITKLAAPASTWAEAMSALQLTDATSATGEFSDEDDLDLDLAAEHLPIEQELLTWGVIERSDSPELVGTLGRYDLRQVLGFGGTGVVFKALDRELGRVVAVKILAPALSVNGAARRRFAREAQAAAAVVHENVVAVHHVDASGKCPYLVMQYIDGESLQETVSREGPVDVATALRLTMQVADALNSSHAQGLIHRDIKPANLMIGRSGQRLWVTDFGLARAVDDASLTRTGFIAGTPHYMSPEQARGEVVGPSSDLFSLGGTLFFMLTGRAPFRADRTLAILNRICNERHRPIRDVNGDVPEALATLVDRLLSKVPSGRPLTAATVRDECRGMLELHAAGKLPMTTKPRWRYPVTGNRFAIGGLLMLSIVAGGFGWLAWSNQQPPSSQATRRAPINIGSSPVLPGYPVRQRTTDAGLSFAPSQQAFAESDSQPNIATVEELQFANAINQLDSEIQSLERPTSSMNQPSASASFDPGSTAIDQFETDLRQLEKP